MAPQALLTALLLQALLTALLPFPLRLQGQTPQARLNIDQRSEMSTPKAAPLEPQRLGLEQTNIFVSAAGPTPMFAVRTLTELSPALL